MKVRFLFLVLIIIGAATGPWWLLLPFFVLYAAVYQGLETVVVAFCVDAYFGNGVVSFPYYTMIATFVLAITILLKPYLSLYDR